MSRTAIARVIYPVHNLLSEGRLSSWYISLDIHSQLEQTLLSSSWHISAFLSLNLMYRYLKKFKDPIQESSLPHLFLRFLFFFTFYILYQMIDILFYCNMNLSDDNISFKHLGGADEKTNVCLKTTWIYDIKLAKW